MATQTATATAETPRAQTPVDAPTRPDEAAPDAGTGPATGGPTGAVWKALTGNPDGATAAQLTIAAGVSKNAARKALARLEADGCATRTAGGRSGGKRAADTWRPATPPTGEASTGEPTEIDTEAAPPQDRETDGEKATARRAPEPAPTADGSSGAPQEDTAADPDDRETATGETEPPAAEEPDQEEGLDEGAVDAAQTALTDLDAAITAAREALTAGDRAAAKAAAETIYAGSAKARRLVRTAVTPRSRNGNGTGKARPGELRAKVAEHLAAYPGKEFSPHDIGKAIGHSAGAVANALDRLVADEAAILTSERPRRFTGTAPATTGQAAQAPADDEATTS